MLSTWLITDDVNLDNLAQLMFTKFLHCKAIPQFHISWKEVTMNSLCFRWGVSTEIIWNFSVQKMCLFSPISLFIPLFNHLFTGNEGLTVIYYVVWVIIQYNFILLLKLFQLWSLEAFDSFV